MWSRSRQILVRSRYLFLLSWLPFNVYFFTLINSVAFASRLHMGTFGLGGGEGCGGVGGVVMTDPLVVEGLISYNLVSVYLRKLRQDKIVDDATFYKVLPSGFSSGVLELPQIDLGLAMRFRQKKGLSRPGSGSLKIANRSSEQGVTRRRKFLKIY